MAAAAGPHAGAKNFRSRAECRQGILQVQAVDLAVQCSCAAGARTAHRHHRGRVGHERAERVGHRTERTFVTVSPAARCPTRSARSWHPAAVVAVGGVSACGAAALHGQIHGLHLKNALTAFRPAAEVLSAGVGAGVRDMGAGVLQMSAGGRWAQACGRLGQQREDRGGCARTLDESPRRSPGAKGRPLEQIGPPICTLALAICTLALTAIAGLLNLAAAVLPTWCCWLGADGHLPPGGEAGNARRSVQHLPSAARGPRRPGVVDGAARKRLRAAAGACCPPAACRCS